MNPQYAVRIWNRTNPVVNHARSSSFQSVTLSANGKNLEQRLLPTEGKFAFTRCKAVRNRPHPSAVRGSTIRHSLAWQTYAPGSNVAASCGLCAICTWNSEDVNLLTAAACALPCPVNT